MGNIDTQDARCPQCGARISELPWAIYRRLSRKKPPRPTSHGRQRRDDETVEWQDKRIRAYAADESICLCDARDYCDPHYSAWKRKGGKRPDWLRMMRDARAGKLGGIMIWKLDRFTRSPRDMEDLIDLAEDRRVLVDGPGSGRINLRTAKGRKEARDIVNQAAAESDNTSERVSATLNDIAHDGWPMGAGRIFGYERPGDIEHRDHEAEVIRDIAQRHLSGETLASIANSLNSAGITTARDGQWSAANLGRTLGHARYGGWVEWKGELVSRIKPSDPEQIYIPILDADTFDAVQATLARRRRGRRLTGRFLLTGVLLCGRCAAQGRRRTLAGLRESRKQSDGSRRNRYTCLHQRGGCTMSVLADPVERLVRNRVVAELTDPDTVANIAKRNDQLADLRGAAQAEIDAIITELSELEVKKAQSEINERRYGPAAKVYEDRLAKAQLVLEGLDTPNGSGQIETITATDYDLATPDRKRAMIAQLGLSITIMPLAKGQARNTFNPDRVVIDPPEEAH